MLSPFFAFNISTRFVISACLPCLHRQVKAGTQKVKLAERQGFEPWVELSPHTRLAGERLQPTRPSLREFKCLKYIKVS